MNENDKFEKFWNRNTKILLKFCELYNTDKDGFKRIMYDNWEKFGATENIEPKLEKLFKQTRAWKYLYGNKKVKVEKKREILERMKERYREKEEGKDGI